MVEVDAEKVLCGPPAKDIVENSSKNTAIEVSNFFIFALMLRDPFKNIFFYNDSK